MSLASVSPFSLAHIILFILSMAKLRTNKTAKTIQTFKYIFQKGNKLKIALKEGDYTATVDLERDES